MATLEELIAQVEDIEALISALDGLMRDVDDEKIQKRTRKKAAAKPAPEPEPETTEEEKPKRRRRRRS